MMAFSMERSDPTRRCSDGSQIEKGMVMRRRLFKVIDLLVDARDGLVVRGALSVPTDHREACEALPILLLAQMHRLFLLLATFGNLSSVVWLGAHACKRLPVQVMVLVAMSQENQFTGVKRGCSDVEVAS